MGKKRKILTIYIDGFSARRSADWVTRRVACSAVPSRPMEPSPKWPMKNVRPKNDSTAVPNASSPMTNAKHHGSLDRGLP